MSNQKEFGEIVVDLSHAGDVVPHWHVFWFLQKTFHPGFLILEGFLGGESEDYCLNANGSAISRIVHTEDGLQSDAFRFASDGRLTASGGYRHLELQLKAEAQEERPAPPLRQGLLKKF